MMQVKCPKCRFRYDVTVPPGSLEMACVCPRCGTPFTYVPQEVDSRDEHTAQSGSLTDGQSDRDVHDGQLSGASVIVPPVVGRADSSSNTDHSSRHNDNLEWQYIDKPTTNAGVSQQPSAPSGGIPQQPRKRGGFFRSCFFIFFVLLLMAVLGIRSCWQSAKTQRVEGASLSDASTEYRHEQGDMPEPATSEVDPFEEIHPGKAPSWIQGNWKFEAEYGVIRLTIHDKKITETIGNDTASGTFYYENRRLICDFGDPNNITIYRLDIDRQQIDAGNGMLMTKE